MTAGGDGTMALGPRRLVYGEVDLFRYSAVTGNAHRIHYDAPYAQREGFAGPLVHSTLHATMLFMTLRDALTGDARIDAFRWRNHRPLTATTPVTIRGTMTPTSDGDLAAELASYRDDGELVASAQATVRTGTRLAAHQPHLVGDQPPARPPRPGGATRR